MPGPVSDSYDPEWGTADNGGLIADALRSVYEHVTKILDGKPPKYILDLLQEDMCQQIHATLTEKEWRLIRFALERAEESV
jgi:hypothetical protein